MSNNTDNKNKFRRRPFAYPIAVVKKRDSFRVPYTFQKPTIGRFFITFPFWNGRFAFLELPCDYCEHDIRIVLKQLEVIKVSLEK